MSDLTERLLAEAAHTTWLVNAEDGALLHDAVERIQSLEAELDRVRGAFAVSPGYLSGQAFPATVMEHLLTIQRALKSIPDSTVIDDAIAYSMSDDVPESICIALSYADNAVTIARQALSPGEP